MLVSSIASLVLLGLTSASPIIKVPSPEELMAPRDGHTYNIEARDDNVRMCKGNECGDCPCYFGVGTGYPACPVYKTEQLEQTGFSRDESGRMVVYLDFPEPGPQCKYIIRTPVVPDDATCGRPAVIVDGAQCVQLTLASTMLGQFCCGTGDYGAAGAPPIKRDAEVFGLASSPMSFVLHKNGKAIHPEIFDHLTNSHRPLNQQELAVVKRHATLPSSPRQVNDAVTENHSLSSRGCGKGDFVITKPSYHKAGQSKAVSPVVGCSPEGACTAQMSETVEETRTMSVEVSVGDPFGIISASAGFSYSKSISRSFSSSYEFHAGGSGYVVFTPILSCVQGYFNDDCKDANKIIEACTPTKDKQDQLYGELAGVTIRH